MQPFLITIIVNGQVKTRRLYARDINHAKSIAENLLSKCGTLQSVEHA